jgi:ADP-ribose pyrophosphatase
MPVNVNDRRCIHHGRVFDLVRENVTLDNGATTDLDKIVHPERLPVMLRTRTLRMTILASAASG